MNLNELDNTDNLEDGRPSNAFITYHVTVNEDFTQLMTYIPKHKKLKNGGFTSLTMRITDQNGNIITDGPQVTVVLHKATVNYNVYKNGIWKQAKPRTFTVNSSWNEKNQTKSNYHSQSQ